MQFPFFYCESFAAVGETQTLNDETSRHAVSVLRMKEGDHMHLTDGKGNLVTAEVINDHKKHCEVVIKTSGFQPRAEKQVTIAISLLKNSSRFEWFLEKVTEIGVASITPLICERTERQHFRKDRMGGLLISAMLQSQQCWLPDLQEPIKFDKYVNTHYKDSNLFIAHCGEQHKQSLLSHIRPSASDSTNAMLGKHSHICIGPEGDFTRNEIEQALSHQFIPVTLGQTRLRSETAGIVAATILCIAS